MAIFLYATSSSRLSEDTRKRVIRWVLSKLFVKCEMNCEASSRQPWNVFLMKTNEHSLQRKLCLTIPYDITTCRSKNIFRFDEFRRRSRLKHKSFAGNFNFLKYFSMEMTHFLDGAIEMLARYNRRETLFLSTGYRPTWLARPSGELRRCLRVKKLSTKMSMALKSLRCLVKNAIVKLLNFNTKAAASLHLSANNIDKLNAFLPRKGW